MGNSSQKSMKKPGPYVPLLGLAQESDKISDMPSSLKDRLEVGQDELDFFNLKNGMFPAPQGVMRSAMIRGGHNGTPQLLDANGPLLSSELFNSLISSPGKAHSHSRQKSLYSPGSLSDRRKGSEEPSDLGNDSPELRQPKTDRY